MFLPFSTCMMRTFYILVLLIPNYLITQVNIFNRSLTDSSLRIVYIGVDNFLEIKGVIKDSVASINEILINPFLRLFRENCFYKKQFMITSFRATFIGYDLDSLNTNAPGNLLTQEQIDQIKKLRRGDKIFFNEIYAVGPDSRRRKLTPFIIIIE